MSTRGQCTVCKARLVDRLHGWCQPCKDALERLHGSGRRLRADFDFALADKGRAARLAVYAFRAALGVPLFDPPVE